MNAKHRKSIKGAAKVQQSGWLTSVLVVSDAEQEAQQVAGAGAFIQQGVRIAWQLEQQAERYERVRRHPGAAARVLTARSATDGIHT